MKRCYSSYLSNCENTKMKEVFLINKIDIVSDNQKLQKSHNNSDCSNKYKIIKNTFSRGNVFVSGVAFKKEKTK